MARLGDCIGPYRTEEVLGQGSLGTVIRARHTTTGALVAIKVLREDLVADPASRRRLVHEARHAAELRHEHVLSVVDVVDEEGSAPYLVFEYIPGGSLHARLRDQGPLSPLDAVALAGEVADALDALHGRGLVHRDVKSTNVMFRDDGSAVLADLGLARAAADTRLTAAGEVLGTLDYLAPELIRGAEATPATDLYAFGCVVYECLVGAPPFRHLPALAVASAHVNEAPPDVGVVRSEVPPALAWAVVRALAKDPRDRPPTALTYARLLQAACAG